MRNVDNAVPSALVHHDEVLASGGWFGTDLTARLLFQGAAVSAWILETDFTHRELDTLADNLKADWRDRSTRSIFLNYANSLDKLRADPGGRRELWRSQRLEHLRSVKFCIDVPGPPRSTPHYRWMEQLDIANRPMLTTSSRLTLQAAESFVEAVMMLANMMVHGETSAWTVDYSVYPAARRFVVVSWPDIDASARHLIETAPDWWGAMCWDGASLVPWYEAFWLHHIAQELAAHFVNGFPERRGALALDFWAHVQRKAEAERARARARAQAEAAERAQRIAAAARAGRAPYRDDRDFVRGAMAQSRANFSKTLAIQASLSRAHSTGVYQWVV